VPVKRASGEATKLRKHGVANPRRGWNSLMIIPFGLHERSFASSFRTPRAVSNRRSLLRLARIRKSIIPATAAAIHVAQIVDFPSIHIKLNAETRAFSAKAHVFGSQACGGPGPPLPGRREFSRNGKKTTVEAGQITLCRSRPR
jgi:hypothetical protein